MSGMKFDIPIEEQTMKTMLARIVAIATAMLLAAGASAADVQTTADPDAKLAGYRTFSFLESVPNAPGAIKDAAVRNRLRNAIAIRLVKKGYTPAAPGQAGDLGVHYTGQVVEKQSVLVVGRPGPYSYNWGRTELGGTRTTTYREGTLFIDLVDVAKSRLLWRTHFSEAFSEGYSEDNWKKLDRALDEAFKSLPQRK